MGRVINLESAGKERNRLVKSVVIALRELSLQTEVVEETRDIAAYIALALIEISKTIDPTVEPWEKRGYWVKADRFRMEWEWCDKYGKEMLDAVVEENWGIIATTSAAISTKITNINVSPRHRMGKPWVGAWKRYQKAQ